MICFLCFSIGLALAEIMHWRIRNAEASAFLRGRTAARRMTDAHVNTPMHADDFVLLTPAEALTLQRVGRVKTHGAR